MLWPSNRQRSALGPELRGMRSLQCESMARTNMRYNMKPSVIECIPFEQVIDEPLFLMHHIDIMVSVTGSNLLQGFRESLLPHAGQTGHPEEEDDDEDVNSLLMRLPPDTRPFEEFLTAAQGCLLLLMLKQHLKEQYGLTDAKITQYSPSEGAKVYEKNAPRKAINIFMPRPTLNALKGTPNHICFSFTSFYWFTPSKPNWQWARVHSSVGFDEFILKPVWLIIFPIRFFGIDRFSAFSPSSIDFPAPTDLSISDETRVHLQLSIHHVTKRPYWTWWDCFFCVCFWRSRETHAGKRAGRRRPAGADWKVPRVQTADAEDRSGRGRRRGGRRAAGRGHADLPGQRVADSGRSAARDGPDGRASDAGRHLPAAAAATRPPPPTRGHDAVETRHEAARRPPLPAQRQQIGVGQEKTGPPQAQAPARQRREQRRLGLRSRLSSVSSSPPHPHPTPHSAERSRFQCLSPPFRTKPIELETRTKPNSSRRGNPLTPPLRPSSTHHQGVQRVSITLNIHMIIFKKSPSPPCPNVNSSFMI